MNHTMVGTFATPTLAVDHAVRAMAQGGWLGVDLFFVLSGFLVTGILLDTKGESNWWRNFITRRALRIFPLYYAALFLMFVVLPRIGWSDPKLNVLLENQAWFWTYTVNILGGLTQAEGTPLGTGHLWSLSIEEQFYLLWPLLVWRCRPKTLLWICALAPLGGLLFRAWCVFHLGDPRAAYLFTPGHFDALLVGAALAVGARQGEGLIPWRRWVAPALVLSIAGLAIIAADGGLNILNADVALAGLPLVALLFGAVLVMVVTGSGESPWGRALRNPTLRRWGIYSYGIYLIHLPLTVWLDGEFELAQYSAAWAGGSYVPALLQLAGMVMALSYLAAWCSYHGYEKHFLALKRYFESPKPDGTGDGDRSREPRPSISER